MKHRSFFSLIRTLLLPTFSVLLLVCTSCKEGASSRVPQKLSDTELTDQIPVHIGKSQPAIAEKARMLSQHIQSHRPVEAFDQALQLMSERQLSEEEREWVVESFTRVMTTLQKAADQGNREAKAALDDYRANK